MKSRATLLGHPIHPMLITFPVGLLVTGVIFEIVGLIAGHNRWEQAAFYMIAAGIIGGLLAGLFGAIDYTAIPAGTRAKGVATMHGTGNVIMLVLFAVAWLIWRPTEQHPNAAVVILTIAGVAIIAFTGWLGGELVDRLGVGVDPGANLNASSSLTGQAAADTVVGAPRASRRA